MSVFEKGIITILGCNLLFALIAIPLAMRRVPRNIIYGFRTRATLSDDHIWYEANAHFGRGLIKASIITAVTATLLFLTRGLSPELFLMASVAALVVPSLLAAIATERFVRSLKQDDPGRRRPH